MQPTAKNFIARMKEHQSDEEREKLMRYFRQAEGDKFMGIRMGTLFNIAKEFISMPVSEIGNLLDSPIHEVRAGALSVMDKQSRNKKITQEELKQLYDLYISRHDRINNWDLVDLAAIHVVGQYLIDKPRKILYKLAKSKNTWERRTAIVATACFIKKGEVEDTFAIAEILLKDKEDLIHKAAGGWIREAGKKHKPRLVAFLDAHAATMPRTMLRYAVEHLNPKEKAHYMGLSKK